jgi:hypothetical protein
MENKVLCEICNKGFATFNTLSNHKRRFHSDVRDSKKDFEYVCSKCNKIYETQLSLLRHSITCVGTNRVIKEESKQEDDSDNESQLNDFDMSYTLDNRTIIPMDEHTTIMIKLQKYIIKLQRNLITSNAIIDKLIQFIRPQQNT